MKTATRTLTPTRRLDLFQLSTSLGEMAGVLEGIAEGILLLRGKSGHIQGRDERTDWYLGILEDRLLEEVDRLKDFETELLAAGRPGRAPQHGRAGPATQAQRTHPARSSHGGRGTDGARGGEAAAACREACRPGG